MLSVCQVTSLHVFPAKPPKTLVVRPYRRKAGCLCGRPHLGENVILHHFRTQEGSFHAKNLQTPELFCTFPTENLQNPNKKFAPGQKNMGVTPCVPTFGVSY